ncbi:MAG: UDP-2,3-diacylglucosamine diphosphatase [Gammaproteobacteria bacterium]|nr:UDP-2,3-diacylglucosamine diphosphatase [Gammaproteobacteria bacterium]
MQLIEQAGFIADLHLCQQRPQSLQRFYRLLADFNLPHLFILGDLFEFWVGDDAPPEGMAAVIQALAQASERGIHIAICHGNRDFLLGTQFARTSGCQLLEEATEIQLGDRPTLLLHGDTLCSDDHDYQQLRQQLRDPKWIAQFLAQSVSSRLEQGERLRAASYAAFLAKNSVMDEVNAATVSDIMTRYQVTTLIHGHTHRQQHHQLTLANQQSADRYVLGDWHEAGATLLRFEQSQLHYQSLP